MEPQPAFPGIMRTKIMLQVCGINAVDACGKEASIFHPSVLPVWLGSSWREGATVCCPQTNIPSGRGKTGHSLAVLSRLWPSSQNLAWELTREDQYPRRSTRTVARGTLGPQHQPENLNQPPRGVLPPVQSDSCWLWLQKQVT